MRQDNVRLYNADFYFYPYRNFLPACVLRCAGKGPAMKKTVHTNRTYKDSVFRMVKTARARKERGLPGAGI